MDDPNRLALDIIEMRAYAAAKHALDTAQSAEEIPEGEIMDIVKLNTERAIREIWAEADDGD